MGIALYMDHHVPRSITIGLRMRGVDVITAHDDGASAMGDPELLDRACELGRVIFSQDDDLVTEAVKRQRQHAGFGGVIYAHQLRMSIGALIHELEIIAKAGEPEDLINKIQFLPL
jgi:hypothetical protein